MESSYRRKYTKIVDGRKVKKQSQCWYIKYKDADGIKQRAKGFKDKAATQQPAAKLEKEAELERAGFGLQSMKVEEPGLAFTDFGNMIRADCNTRLR